MRKKIVSKPKKSLKKVSGGSAGVHHHLHKPVPHMTSFMVISGTIAVMLLGVAIVKNALGLNGY